MQEMKPMRWPRPVPTLWWTADYSDIRERVRRDGRLDTDEVWSASSGDGWRAFRSRHGDYNFEQDFRTIDTRNREQLERTKSRWEHERHTRQTEQAREQQEQWEAGQRERQLAKQAAADRDWHEIDEAKRYWSKVLPSYAAQPFRSVTIKVSGTINGIPLRAGGTYWLPEPLAKRLQHSGE